MSVSQVSRRKRLGAWYTPPALVAAVVDALDLRTLVERCGPTPVRVLDPACGDGRFLFAVRAAVEALGGRAELTGVDIDPEAPVFDEPGGTWICGDARAMPWLRAPLPSLSPCTSPSPSPSPSPPSPSSSPSSLSLPSPSPLPSPSQWPSSAPLPLPLPLPLPSSLSSSSSPSSPSPSSPSPSADTAAVAGFDGGFDVVVGNPPFLSQLATATTRGGRSHLGGGPYADAAAEFLALAVSLVRPGGRLGMVLPQPLLSARDAAPIRSDVDRRAALRWVWWSTTPMFDAAVHTWAGVWEIGGSASAVARSFGPGFVAAPPLRRAAATRSWSALIGARTGGAELDNPSDGPRLDSIASFLVDFRDSYYGLVAAVGDEVDGPPLITSGLIEPGRCLWGERPARFAKQRFAAPRVDLARLAPVMQRWAAQRLVPKILIANQTRIIEAVHDPGGAWLPSVPVLTCTTADPERVLAVLASDAAVRWVHHHAAGSGLGPHSVRLTPALLASIPLP